LSSCGKALTLEISKRSETVPVRVAAADELVAVSAIAFLALVLVEGGSSKYLGLIVRLNIIS